MSRLNLLDRLTAGAHLSRIARSLESLSRTQADRLKLELIRAQITPEELAEADMTRPKEPAAAAPAPGFISRLVGGFQKTPAQPPRGTVVAQSGEELAFLSGLAPGSPEFREEIRRQLASARSSKLPTLEPEADLEEMARYLGFIPDSPTPGGPEITSSPSPGLPPREPE
jgi:hypothetical protein